MNKETLNKSLEILDAAADELLQKSAKKSEDVTPSDISDTETKDDEDEDTVEKGGKTCENCKNCDDSDLNKSEDSSDEDSDEEDTEDNDEAEDTEKSISDFQADIDGIFYADSDIKTGAGSSEFQAGIVAAMSKALAEIQYDIYSSNKGQNSVSSVLAKSLKALITSNQLLKSENDKLLRRVNHLEKSIDQKFDQILDSLDSFSIQPAHMRKSVGSISVHDKNFNTSLTGTNTTDINSLTKSQVLDVLTQQLYAGNSVVRPDDVIAYESGAPLRPELQTLVANSLH